MGFILYIGECLVICVEQNLRLTEMAGILDRIAINRPLPTLFKTDNSPKFEGEMLENWVYERMIRIDFSRPRTPTENATVEAFNGKLWQECIN